MIPSLKDSGAHDSLSGSPIFHPSLAAGLPCGLFFAAVILPPLLFLAIL